MVPTAKQKDFANAVNSALKVTPGNTLTPTVAKEAESELGRLARQYSGSGVAEERELGRAFLQAQANLRELVADNNPMLAGRIRDINKAWADLVQLEALLPDLKAAGMQAIEVYYKNYDVPTIERLRKLAEGFELIPLGGSDYHGIHSDEVGPGNIPLPDSSIERLLGAARKLPNRELVAG